ncbi:MAG: ATPase [Clostridiales bacterium]|nr:ATPase [Clostridiales bacterium]
MGASRIEQIIEDIYEFIESCRMQPLSSTKVIVPKDELYDLLDELRLRTPDEIKRYQKIIANRDAIIADAEEKAEAILAQAREKSKDILNDHEIMQQAYYEANEIISRASNEATNILESSKAEAEQIRASALAYTNDLLTQVESILAGAYQTSVERYDSFIGSLKNNLDIINSNRSELYEQLYPQNNVQSAANVNHSDEDQYDFEEDRFLEDID